MPWYHLTTLDIRNCLLFLKLTGFEGDGRAWNWKRWKPLMRKICKSRDYFELLLSWFSIKWRKCVLWKFKTPEPKVFIFYSLNVACASNVLEENWILRWGEKINHQEQKRHEEGEWKNHKISLQIENSIDMLLHENIVKVSIQKPSNSIFCVSYLLSFFFPFSLVFEASIDFFFPSCVHIKWKKLHFRFQHRIIFYRMNSILSGKKCRMKKGGGKRRGNWILKQYHQHHHREFPLFLFIFFVFPFSSNLICNLVQEMWKHHETWMSQELHFEDEIKTITLET